MDTAINPDLPEFDPYNPYAEYHSILTERCGVSEDVLDFATTIYGDNPHTLEQLLYWATGLRSFDQLDDHDEDEGQGCPCCCN